MKIVRKVLSIKIDGYVIGISIFILFSILVLTSKQPDPKTTRQVGSSSDHLQILWTSRMHIWNQTADQDSNVIYVDDAGTIEQLLAIDSLTGSTIWQVSLMESDWRGELNQWGVQYLLAANKTVFTVTGTHVNAYRASTGELLWWTKLGDGHVSIYAQEEDPLLRIYYGNKIFEISQVSGEILSEQPKDDIVWIQNNIEIHCPLSPAQDGASQDCWIGLTGTDRVTGKTLWKNNRAHFSESYQEQTVNNMVLAGFSEDGICTLDPVTGEHFWCLPGGKISNIAIDRDKNTGYFLRNDFNLVKINLLTGGILAKTQFLPLEKIQQNSYSTVAITKDTVIVSFGDSKETFGLRLNP